MKIHDIHNRIKHYPYFIKNNEVYIYKGRTCLNGKYKQSFIYWLISDNNYYIEFPFSDFHHCKDSLLRKYFYIKKEALKKFPELFI